MSEEDKFKKLANWVESYNQKPDQKRYIMNEGNTGVEKTTDQLLIACINRLEEVDKRNAALVAALKELIERLENWQGASFLPTSLASEWQRNDKSAIENAKKLIG